MRTYINGLALPTGTPAPLVSAPTNHEVAGFMPGRLEFEHEIDNEAEMPVKDMEFGLVFKYDGDKQPEAKPSVVKPAEDEEEEADAADGDAKGGDDVQVKQENDDDEEKPSIETETEADRNGTGSKEKEKKKRKGKEKAAEDEEADEAGPEQVVEIEDEDELEVKLALLDIYFSKLDKREDAKNLIFDRGLTEYKKVSWMTPQGTRHKLTTCRYKPMKGSGQKMRGSWYIDTRSLRNFKRLWTTKS